MTREDIKQLIFNRLGVILVDKEEIHENSSFKELALDEEDVEQLFSHLETELGFRFPDTFRQIATAASDRLSVHLLAELIFAIRND